MHCRLGDGERCPFLNNSGLCDIICELGDGAICSACEGIEEMLDVVRMYSSEIEYCEENAEKVKMFLE